MSSNNQKKPNNSKEQWIEKLLRFFRQMPGHKPDPEETDYSGWNQSEEEYQKQQKKWLEEIRTSKEKKKRGKNRK